ncbi:Quinolinate synthase A [Candidatus Nitrosocosmicus franklandus]|uniref:Quinolinate synthase n=2 Tax=Candidatus Nitrosocosmicus franklandianus TaxID=1798806 RepID=A0A484IC63_9ARCH|nr:quinolinate synthase NadA [Candidatus Nitrosocosmicus franklandus]VFJ14680.1 Quinolinate synthase A [Candidatus Nitrosocosmicus franklandus]
MQLMSVLNLDLTKEIQRLKKEKNAIVLAHNYQISPVQDVADFVGDSLKLSRLAGETDASYIIFCGVHFMAETASIISPDKKVLIPDLEAGCSLASSINPNELLKWKNENPDAVVVSYVNTSAEVKALSDYCCTSSNAVKVVQSIPESNTILFLPDMFLGAYVAEVTKRKNIKIWPGECHVHAGITDKDINRMLNKYVNAEFMVHPECSCTSSTLYHISNGDINGESKILSTEGMMNEARVSKNNQFLVATEVGILSRMRQENPSKEFIPVKEDAICKYMKKITIEKVYNSLVNDVYEVKVPEDIARKAIIPIERMLAIS